MDTYEIASPGGERYELDWHNDDAPTPDQLYGIMQQHTGWDDIQTHDNQKVSPVANPNLFADAHAKSVSPAGSNPSTSTTPKPQKSKNVQPVNQTPTNYSDWNPFTWDYHFNKQDARDIADNMDQIGQGEMNAGTVIGTAGALGGGQYNTPVPGIPFTKIIGKVPINCKPNFIPKTVLGTAAAVGGGLVIGGAGARGIAYIIKKLAK